MMQRQAILNDAREYRYVLERTWNPGFDRVLFVMLNPSTADANAADATIRRCMTFAASGAPGALLSATSSHSGQRTLRDC